MTPMDSDSESQDSDEGRRFRFEATRKDEPVAPVDRSRDRTKSPKKKSKHKSSRCDDSSRHYRERKERSKHESGRKTDDKDLRHLIKHTKHESWSGSRQEDKNSHKDHRDARDASAGANDRGSRHATSGDARERSRDSKRQSDRDWSGVHRGQRSREHSHERNYDELRGDRHRSRCRERHKHRSRDRSRERSHQSTKIKSSSGDRSREDHGKPDSARKSSVKENRSQNSRGDYSSPKSSTECSHSESRSSTLAHLGPSEDDVKKESSLDLAQDCKELDLSQFDVLSETDENTSDGPDSRGRTLSLRHRETKLLPPTSRGRDFSSRDQSESREPPEKRARTEQRQERRKVNMKNDDDDGDEDNDDHVPAPGASNNPSAVSDSSLVPSATVSEKTRDARVDSAREKPERREQESTTLAQNSGDAARPVSRRPGTVSDEARSPERVVEQSGPVYGPLPMTELTSTFDDAELEASPSSHDSSHCETRRKVIDNNDDDGVDNGEKTRARLIGPCLPPIDETKSGIELRANVREATAEVDVPDEADMAFGPALPPHLIQRMRDNESQDKFIGPVMPDAVKKVPSCETLPMESDDDYAIGPLPADHPALRNNRVYEQLEMRAHRIRHEGTEEVDVGNKREEWMTELPSVQAVNLGLGPRKFRVRDGPDMSDRSCWTDTPAQRAQKQRDAEARRLGNTDESDKRRAKERHKKEADKISKREQKSLLEIHQSKMAKKKKKEEEDAKLNDRSTRRPFDRNIDLQVNRFDQAQKKTILMKAQMLDDRFSRGEI